MRAARLQDALERLTAAIRDVESELAAMKSEHDPLASHIFVSRRHYRNINDTKSGKPRETMARLSFETRALRKKCTAFAKTRGAKRKRIRFSFSNSLAVSMVSAISDRAFSLRVVPPRAIPEKTVTTDHFV